MADNALDRQAGVHAMAMRLTKSPRYLSLNPQQRENFLGKYYSQFVMPAYATSQLQPPDKATWISQFTRPGGPIMSTEGFYINRGRGADALTDFESTMLNVGASATKALGGILNGPIVAGFKGAVDQKLFGLNGFFPAPGKNTLRDKLLAQDKQIYSDPTVQGFMRMNHRMIDDANFWFQTRPSATLSERIGSMVGEQSVMLPLYEAIGAPLRFGGKLLTADKFLKGEVGGAGVAANLTRRFAATPKGQFVGRRIINMAEAYLSGVAAGESPAERDTSIVRFMIGSSVLEGGGALLKGVTGGVIKGLDRVSTEASIAHDLTLGGVPYVEAVTDQAVHELRTDTIGHDSAGQPIQHDGSVEGATAALKTAKKADPIKTAAVTTAQVRLSAIAKRLFGPKATIKGLSEEQLAQVTAEHARITAKATQTAPVHVKEVGKATVQSSIQKDIEQNPELAQTYARINELGKPHGVSVESATQEAEIDNLKDQTGMRSVQGASDKAARIAAKQKDRLVNDIVRDTRAKAAARTRPRGEDPRSYVSFKVNTLQHFTNNFKSAAKKSNQTLASFIRGMDDDDFVKEVKDQMGNSIRFEKPQDAMLWAIHHGDSVPAPIRNRVVRWFKDQDPTVTMTSLKDEAKILDHHIEMLAYTGRLDKQGNVFKSTVTSDWTSRTKWQQGLLRELGIAELNDYEKVMGVWAKNYPKQYAAGIAELARLQTVRMKLKSLEAVIEKTRGIREKIYGGRPVDRLSEADARARLQHYGYEARP